MFPVGAPLAISRGAGRHASGEAGTTCWGGRKPRHVPGHAEPHRITGHPQRGHDIAKEPLRQQRTREVEDDTPGVRAQIQRAIGKVLRGRALVPIIPRAWSEDMLDPADVRSADVARGGGNVVLPGQHPLNLGERKPVETVPPPGQSFGWRIVDRQARAIAARDRVDRDPPFLERSRRVREASRKASPAELVLVVIAEQWVIEHG